MNLATDVLRFYRTWNEVDPVIVDGALGVGPKAAPGYDLQRLDAWLSDLLARASEQMQEGAPFAAYTAAKLKCSALHMELTRDRPTASRAILARSGTPWTPVDPADLARWHREYRELRAVSPEPAGFFDEPLTIGDACTFIMREAPRWLALLREHVVDFDNFSFDCVEAVEDIAHQAVVAKTSNGFRLLLNARSGGDLTRSRLRFLCLHEICGHMVHLSTLFSDPLLRCDAPHLLAIATHTLDAFMLEGMAQALSMALAHRVQDAEPAVAAEMALNNLTLAVIHGNVMDILDGKKGASGAAACHSDFLGGAPSDHLVMYERVPQGIAHILVCQNYYASIKVLEPLMTMDPARQRATFARLLRTFATPESLRSLLDVKRIDV